MCYNCDITVLYQGVILITLRFYVENPTVCVDVSDEAALVRGVEGCISVHWNLLTGTNKRNSYWTEGLSQLVFSVPFYKASS